jgi:hypothetical protein
MSAPSSGTNCPEFESLWRITEWGLNGQRHIPFAAIIHQRIHASTFIDTPSSGPRPFEHGSIAWPEGGWCSNLDGIAKN